MPASQEPKDNDAAARLNMAADAAIEMRIDKIKQRQSACADAGLCNQFEQFAVHCVCLTCEHPYLSVDGRCTECDEFVGGIVWPIGPPSNED